jgi:DNA-directed RNA polymerase specialized sigma24 family protein
VLIARTYEGLTFAEIAVELGIAVPTVKTHYLRAVSAVRDRLMRFEGQERM